MSPPIKIFLLIGDPVEQSLSPAMQNAAFKVLGLNCIYAAIDVPQRFLADAIAGVRAMKISGLNVTIPHKIAVAGLLDELDESASLAGAVNTIKNQRGKLIGFNTDGEGALRAFKNKIGSVKGKDAVLLGAGGAGRAIAFSLARAGARLTIANRTISRAKVLASMIEQKLGVGVAAIPLNRERLKKVLKDADVLINSTSVGMHPATDQTLVTSDMMHRGLVVNDIVYKPLETRLLREARRAGAKTIDGLGMLVHQGALSFEIWTGRRAPIKVMDAAARRELRGKNR